MELENAFLKAPWEGLVKQFRSGKKLMDKEMDAVSSAITYIREKARSESPEVIKSDMRDLIVRIRGLKRRICELHAEEEERMRNVKARLDYLSSPGASTSCSTNSSPRRDPPDPNAGARWEKTRFERFMIDWMLRQGLYECADRMVRFVGFPELCDSELFQKSIKIVEALKRRDCSEALKWFGANRRRLVKAGSQLELKLRLQEFIELRRDDKPDEAIAYARRHFPGYVDNSLCEIQRAMGLLAFPKDTTCYPYKDMYSLERWDDLIAMFKCDYHRLHGLTKDATLEIVMKAGLATLKTQHCAKEDSDQRNANCPTCTEPYATLAAPLPRSMHVHSVLVCRITGEIMDENNPPMVLPDGNVYSAKAISAMTVKNKNEFTDPKTNKTFSLDPPFRKAFIM